MKGCSGLCRRGLQDDILLIALDRIGAGAGQNLRAGRGIRRIGQQFNNPVLAHHRVADDWGRGFVQFQFVGPSQGDENMVEGLAADEPSPIGFRSFQRPERCRRCSGA